MKKIIFVLCAVALLGMASCSKEEVTPTTPGQEEPGTNPGTNPGTDPGTEPGSDSTYEELDTEGMYGPERRLSVVSENGTNVESWIWQNDRLMSVTDIATGEQKSSFVYGNDNRVQSVTLVGNSDIALIGNMLNGTFTVAYNGQYINKLTLSRNAVQIAEAQISHNASGKVSHIGLTLNDEVMLPMVNNIIAQAAGNSSNIPTFTLSGATGSLDFSWTGQNVVQARLNVGITANTTKGEIMNSALANYIGSISAYLNYLPDNTPIVFNITISDTADYEYDSQNNPFRHFLGQIDISTLSANNIILESHSAGATIKAGLSASLMVPLFNYPLRQGTTTYTYTYENNFPATITASDGTVRGYLYQ